VGHFQFRIGEMAFCLQLALECIDARLVGRAIHAIRLLVESGLALGGGFQGSAQVGPLCRGRARKTHGEDEDEDGGVHGFPGTLFQPVLRDITA